MNNQLSRIVGFGLDLPFSFRKNQKKRGKRVSQYSLRVKSRKQYQQKQKWTIQGEKTKRTSNRLFPPFFLLSCKFASTFLCSRTRAYAKQGEQKKKRNEGCFLHIHVRILREKGEARHAQSVCVSIQNCVCSVGGKRKEAAGKNVGKNKKAAR
jgi:hypothetical protein